MSASSKKKLRNAQESEKLTERQVSAQKEAKKLKIYTAAFIVITVILLVTAITVGVMQIIDKSGIRQKNSVAMTVGDSQINALEMSYFYVDAVQNFRNSNSDFLMYLLDTTTPLNQQVYSQDDGTTWADYFLTIAQSNAEYVYTLYNAAMAEGYTMTDAEKLELENAINTISFYASMNGFADTDAYIKAVYGATANEEGFRAYQEKVSLATSYRNAYADALHYDEAALEQAQKDNYDLYSSFSFNSYYISASRFLEGGTTDENGTVSYSDEEKAASVADAEEAAKTLAGTAYDSADAFDAAIAALPANEGMTTAKSSANSNVLYTSVVSSLSEEMAQWLADGRKEGDIGYFAYESAGTVNGYYVLYFVEKNDNNVFLPTVRHILVGSEAVLNGAETYTAETLAAYKDEAESLLQQWKDMGGTEQAFGELASMTTKDTASASVGGLYQNIVPGQMVDAFNDWCFDKHQVGDTGIVETEYGYHIIYFCGVSEDTYRNQMITSELTNAELERWYEELHSQYPVVLGDSTYLPMNMIIGG